MKSSQARPIALFLSNLGGGGVQRVMLNLAEIFLQQGIPVDLVIARVEGAFATELPRGARIVNLGARRMAGAFLPLARYLRAERPRAMLSAGDRANLLSIWARALTRVDTRVVISVHIAVSAHWQFATHRREWMLRDVVRRFYSWADAIVTVSRAAAAELAEELGVEAGRITSIYNPVVTPELRARGADPCPHPWFQDHQPPVILGVGRLTAQKDFGTLLRAFAQVRRTRRARLLILGEGEERPELEALAGELGVVEDVEFAGFRANPFPYMSNADCFVLSSAWEGLPTVLIEALAMGAPVVATDCRTGPAEILHHGELGLLVPVRDHDRLARAIVCVLDEDTPDSRRFDPTEYLPETSARHYLEVLSPSSATRPSRSFGGRTTRRADLQG